MKRVAINGLGREGRSMLRQYAQTQFNDIQIVAANDIMAAENAAYLLKYDSTFGPFRDSVKAVENRLQFGDNSIKLFSESDPANLPWADLNIDVVIECSGKFTSREAASKHLQAGAGRVLIAAPSLDADIMVVTGVNEQAFNPQKHSIVSNASCTTNSLAPVLKLMSDNYGIDHALVTTIHSYTVSQSIVDSSNKKMIRGRAGAVNIIPTKTGADKATVAVLPELEGRLTALAVRVPVLNGSLTDISVELQRNTTVAEINAMFAAASTGDLKNIVGYSDEELVSSDIVGDPRSGIVHGLSTRVLNGSAVKLHVWYDNEYAYARRCLELVDQLPF